MDGLTHTKQLLNLLCIVYKFCGPMQSLKKNELPCYMCEAYVDILNTEMITFCIVFRFPRRDMTNKSFFSL